MTETIAAGQRLLCHAELINVELAEAGGNVGSVVGQLVVTRVDDATVWVHWDDPYTVSASEDVRALLSDEDAVLIATIGDRGGSGVEIESFFAQLGWMQDLINGRQVMIESAQVRVFDWPVPGPVIDDSSGSAKLVLGLDHWMRDGGRFAANEYETNHIRQLNDEVAVCAAVAPRSFLMENQFQHHPVTAQIGIAHRRLNRFTDWFSGRPDRPWRWTMYERTHFFNPSAQLAWSAQTSVEAAIAELKPALAAAAALAHDDDKLNAYLWRSDPIHDEFHRRHRITHDALRGWTDRAEAELATWKANTVSPNQHTMFESTLRKYLDTGETPYWLTEATNS